MTGWLSGPLNTIAGGALGEVNNLLAGDFGVLIFSVLALVVTFIVIRYFKKATSSDS